KSHILGEKCPFWKKMSYFRESMVYIEFGSDIWMKRAMSGIKRHLLGRKGECLGEKYIFFMGELSYFAGGNRYFFEKMTCFLQKNGIS
ncbi:hypothetical protein U6X56_12375, partial [Cutibacterium acnes]